VFINFYHLTLLLVFVTTGDYRLRFDIAGLPSFTPTEILTYSMVALHAGRAGFNNSLWKEELTVSFVENRGVFLYFGWAAIASIVGLLVRSSYGLQMFKDLLPSLFIYFFVVRYVSDLQRIKTLLIVYIVGLFINLSFATSQIFFNAPRPVEMSEAANLKMDFSGVVANNIPTGLMAHPNGLAMLLLPAIILVITALIFRLYTGKIFNLLLVLFLTILIFVLAYAHTKGVYAWIIIGMLLLFVYNYLRRWRFITSIFILVSVITGIIYYSYVTSMAESSTLSTIVDRMNLLLVALDIISTDYFVRFFGNAFDTMLQNSSAYSNFEYQNAHNLILNQIIFYGIPACGFYLWFFWATVWRLSILHSITDKHFKALASFLFASLIALFGEYFFEPANEGVVLQAHFFILVALATVVSKISIRQYKQDFIYTSG